MVWQEQLQSHLRQTLTPELYHVIPHVLVALDEIITRKLDLPEARELLAHVPGGDMIILGNISDSKAIAAGAGASALSIDTLNVVVLSSESAHLAKMLDRTQIASEAIEHIARLEEVRRHLSDLLQQSSGIPRAYGSEQLQDEIVQARATIAELKQALRQQSFHIADAPYDFPLSSVSEALPQRTPAVLSISYRYRAGPEKKYQTRGSQDEVLVGLRGARRVDLDLFPDRACAHEHLRLFYDLSTWHAEPIAVDPIYHNDLVLTDVVEIQSGDILQIGQTTLELRFLAAGDLPLAGEIERRLPTNDGMAVPVLSEQQRYEIFVRITMIGAHSPNRAAKLAGLLSEIRQVFPQAERCSILLKSGLELLPAEYWPTGQCFASFTLARQAMRSQDALLWVRRQVDRSGAPIPISLQETTAALYAPLIHEQRPIGVIHLDSTRPDAKFSIADQDLLRTIALVAGPALDPTYERNPWASAYPGVILAAGSSDNALAEYLAAELRRRKVRVWINNHHRNDPVWQDQVADALQAVDALVVVGRGDSPADWLLEAAHARMKPIFLLASHDTYAELQRVADTCLLIGDYLQDTLFLLCDHLYQLKQRKASQ